MNLINLPENPRIESTEKFISETFDLILNVGGVKKKSVSQMAKAQSVKESKDVKKDKPKEKTKVTDVSTRGLFIDMDGDRLVKEVSNMKVITPFEVSSKFKVKISVAKDILEELWRKGYIMPVSGNNRIRVFKFIGVRQV